MICGGEGWGVCIIKCSHTLPEHLIINRRSQETSSLLIRIEGTALRTRVSEMQAHCTLIPLSSQTPPSLQPINTPKLLGCVKEKLLCGHFCYSCCKKKKKKDNWALPCTQKYNSLLAQMFLCRIWHLLGSTVEQMFGWWFICWLVQ